jgi:putative transposase
MGAGHVRRPHTRCRRDNARGLEVSRGGLFQCQLVGLWAYDHGTRIGFSRTGKPTDDTFIETFNGSLRDECLNIHWFETLAEAQRLIDAWRIDYNESRPHMDLGNKTLAEYLLQAIPSPSAQGKKRPLKTNAGY